MKQLHYKRGFESVHAALRGCSDGAARCFGKGLPYQKAVSCAMSQSPETESLGQRLNKKLNYALYRTVYSFIPSWRL